MKYIEVEEHKKMMEDPYLTGVFVYSNGCNLCKNQINKLRSYMINVSGVVQCEKDAKYYLDLGYDDMPSTVLYINGKREYIATGEMFDKQLQEFKKTLEKYIENEGE